MRRPEGFDAPVVTAPARRTVESKKTTPIHGQAPSLAVAKQRQHTDVPRHPSAREHRAELRDAAKERRRYERGEVKRFTRRARSRRLTLWGAMALVATLVGLLAIAIYSPILALRTVEVDGTNLLDHEAVSAAVSGQLGTPLALVDFTLIEKQLATFPLIRSYVTETVPPSTLKIHISEREPIAALAVGGTFTVIDPAGVEVSSSATRPPSVPVIDLADDSADSDGFIAVIRVLVALPSTTLAQVDSITASTQDDVTFTLRGVGQRVVWGNADRSAFKSRVLIAMLAKLDPGARLEVDVSAPESVVVTPG
jgi:cell division protein FtsQ